MDRDKLFDLCAYIVASAAGLKDEPKDYGPLRLLEVLNRLATLAAEEYGDTFLERVAEEVDKGEELLQKDQEGFYHFLEELVRRFAREAKNR
ncbi:MAG: DUF6092 family protein [Candidatus Bipolaricaulia bacterium]